MILCGKIIINYLKNLKGGKIYKSLKRGINKK
jgi:hypothetical protein